MIKIKSHEAKIRFAEAIAAMRTFRKVKKPQGMSLQQMIAKGRRYSRLTLSLYVLPHFLFRCHPREGGDDIEVEVS